MPTIDFERLTAAVPEGGELVIKLTRKGKKFQMVYAPKGKSDKGQDLGPLMLTGTAEELSNDFETVMTDVLPLEKMLSNAEKIEKRKTSAEETVKGKDSKKGSGSKPDAEETGLFKKGDK
jgi:PRTRC genetic system protein E